MAENIVAEDLKIIATNKKAFHNYHVLERYEAGIVLSGTEVKSLRDGRINLKDSYALVRQGEVFLLNCHISPYSHGNRENQEPTRTRKLLLHKREIQKLIGKTVEKGLSLVPLSVYFKTGRAKVEIAVVKGKKLFDKRETERRKESDRELARIMKNARR